MLKSRGKDPDVWYQVAEVRGLSGNTVGLVPARGEFFASATTRKPWNSLTTPKRRAITLSAGITHRCARQRELIEEQRIIEQML
jgi:predicted Zn-dependent protease